MSYSPRPALLGLPSATVFALFFLLPLLLPSARSQTINTTTISNKTYSTYYFPFFTSVNNNSNLLLLKDAGYSHGALQLTPDSLNDIKYLTNKSGRVFFTTSFRLWEDRISPSDNTTKYVASFNASFNINIFRQNGTIPGEGLAFLIASIPEAPPPGSEGGYLGLTNATLNGNPDNRFVAIELDTVKEEYDPNDNHVGLDINSVNSTVTANLSFQIAPVIATNYTVWVDYDGVSRQMWVHMAIVGDPKPPAAVLSSPLDLSDHLTQNSYFGFSASTGTNYELNCVLAWNLTVEILPDDNKSRMPTWKLAVIISSGVLAIMILLSVLLVGLYVRKRKAGDGPSAVVLGMLKSLPGTPREFEFRVLNKATDNFDEKMKLGKGGFGEVYKGMLPGENKAVAVKKFSRDNSRQDDFLKELTIINRLRHKHLVPLVGWCYTSGMLLLVYDYMPNGSLDQHLFGGPDMPILNWERRYNVITGVASALHYLHDEYEQRVVHRDLKASNIMLDANFNARLGDFGLARAIETDRTSYAEIELGGVPGTMGYIAPECFHTGKATCESDVFGFGAVVLEVVCGRRPRSDIAGFKFLSDWVWKLHREGRVLESVDPRLEGVYVPADAERLLLLGLACSHPSPGERPKMQAVVQIVSRAVAPPAVPHFKPAFVWPSGPVDEGDARPSSRLTSSSSAVMSSYYASSAECTSSQYVSREGHVGPTDASVSTV
ncbi:hypothetical protein OPV22_032033 [Ensete ventricosum]|uniref:Protein kinase domain-containing protein n=1 Tax=Ensete ventricosum TaxID=4639 RepID=A0AAV8PM08_ENSVE|nr:hypothetical protein OPV22_032033 [Ensete ventricosum]RWW32025.1 hypothetical protein GW17_00003323 [Ensete ventricosum]